MDWFLLPPATESMIQDVSLAAKGRFTGDPSHVYEHVKPPKQGDPEEVVVSQSGKSKSTLLTSDDIKSSLASPVSQTQVTEETRLAVAVHHIDEEVSVVPRGAFVKDPHAVVKVNRSFGGKSEC